MSQARRMLSLELEAVGDERMSGRATYLRLHGEGLDLGSKLEQLVA